MPPFWRPSRSSLFLIALAREPRPWFRFLLGWSAGVVYWFGVCYWIQFTLEHYGAMGTWGSWGTFLLFCVLKAIHLGIFALLAAVLLPHRYAIPAVAALWTGIERTHSDAGFAWLALGNAGIDMALPLRAAPFIGIYGLSFLFAALSTAVVVMLFRKSRKELYWLAMFAVLFVLPALPAFQAGDQTAVIVQPNLNEDQDWSPVTADLMHRRLIEISLQEALRSSPRLIIWPEAPGPFYFDRDSRFHEMATTLAQQSQTYFLFGTVAHTPKGDPLNSAMMLGAGRQHRGSLRQNPFGPLRRIRAADFRFRESHQPGSGRLRAWFAARAVQRGWPSRRSVHLL